MRTSTLAMLSVAATASCSTSQKAPAECPAVAPSPAPKPRTGPLSSSTANQCPAPPAPRTPGQPADQPNPAAPTLLVSNTCFIAPAGAELFFYDVEHENTIWSFHCMADEAECSGVKFRIGRTGKAVDLMDLSTAASSIIERSPTRLRLQHGRYMFDFQTDRALVVEYIDGKQVAAIPCGFGGPN